MLLNGPWWFRVILIVLAFSIWKPVLFATTHSTLADTIGMESDLRIIEARSGTLPGTVRKNLVVLELQYLSLSSGDQAEICTGIMVVHECAANDVRAIFTELLRIGFPIAKVIPMNCYGLNSDSTGWDDFASMADNNTSAFNYRMKPGLDELSNHSKGIAVDINPLFNPLVRRGANGISNEPPAGEYDPKRPGTLTWEILEPILRPKGWSWGGRWPKPKDYQHIEKHGSCVVSPCWTTGKDKAGQ